MKLYQVLVLALLVFLIVLVPGNSDAAGIYYIQFYMLGFIAFSSMFKNRRMLKTQNVQESSLLVRTVITLCWAVGALYLLETDNHFLSYFGQNYRLIDLLYACCGIGMAFLTNPLYKPKNKTEDK